MRGDVTIYPSRTRIGIKPESRAFSPKENTEKGSYASTPIDEGEEKLDIFDVLGR